MNTSSQEKHTAPWTNVYGLARTLLALGTLMTLLMNSADELFRPIGISLHGVLDRTYPTKASLFMLFPADHLEIARWIAIVILIVAASGWRPRITGLLHWWVAVSYASTAVVLEGGDHVNATITLLLLPIALTDPRRWHWGTPPVLKSARLPIVMSTVALSALFMLRVQAAIIYFNAGVAKMGVTEWNNGTAMWYWLNNEMFSMPEWMHPIMMPILQNEYTVFGFTWGVMLFEVFLAVALVLPKRRWAPILMAGLAFHVGIAVVHGLVSFGIAMCALLVLYLRPMEKTFDFASLTRIPLWNRPGHSVEDRHERVAIATGPTAS